MSLRRRLFHRLERAFMYHDLVEHPYGNEYAREKFTPLGGRRDDE